MSRDPSAFVLGKKEYNVGKHKAARITNGASEYDYYNFDAYLAFVIYNWSLWAIENHTGYPNTLTSEEYAKVLEEIRDGMEEYLDETFSNSMDKDKVNLALDHVRKYFYTLWD